MDLAREPLPECTIEAYGAAVAEIPRSCRCDRQYSWATAWDAVWSLRLIGCSPTPSGLVVVDAAKWAAAIPRRRSKLWPMNSQETATGISYESSSNRCSFLREPALAKAIIERGLRFPTGLGRTLMTDLAGWDAREMESALDSVDVPLLAIQSTTLDTARRRVSLEPGLSSLWLELVSAHVPSASIEMLHGYSHFPESTGRPGYGPDRFLRVARQPPIHRWTHLIALRAMKMLKSDC